MPNCSHHVLVLIAAAVLTGCQTPDPAVKRSEKAADILIESRRSLVVSEQIIANSQAALRTLGAAKGDLRPAFGEFVTQLTAVKRMSAGLSRDGGDVKTEAAAYCSARKSDVATITNDGLRTAAEERTGRMKQQCDDLNERYVRVNAAAADYVRDLGDLQTYLSNELNYAALDGGQRWVNEALSSGERLRRHIRELALRVDLTSNLLSPVPIATTQWPTTLTHNEAMAAPEADR